MSIQTLSSKEEFDQALTAHPGKNVLVVLYDGAASSQAEQFAQKHAATTATFTADCAKEPRIKEFHKVSKLPAAIVYKDGQEVKKVEDIKENQEAMKEVSAMLSA